VAKVFISHRGADIIEAEKLALDIKKHGHDVWLDEWEINLGDSIIQKMNDGLEGSVFVVLCFSAYGVLSPWISREWYSALARQLNGENIKLLPVKLTGGTPPPILADIKYADLINNYNKALSEILIVLG